jgi:mono/diheme cytochrome c family protein
MKRPNCHFTFALFGAVMSAIAQTATSPRLVGNPASGEAFFKVDFPNVHGNGRSCATCHVPEEAFQLSPQNVEARFQALQEARLTDPFADDPLFRSIDANDFASDFTNLRRHALVRVIIQLPVDANGDKLVWPQDDPTATSVAVWRSTPSVLNTAFTAPYQQDRRIATLQDQALGALDGHAEITRDPLPRFLDDIAAFQKGLFSSPAVQALSKALDAGRVPPPTDPFLTPLELEGKALFLIHCVKCHGGPTQTVQLPTLGPGVRNIRVSKPVPPAVAHLPFAPSPVPPRMWIFKGAPNPVPSTDPGMALISGNIAQLNFFDIPPLYGISKTAPYFHDNSAATLEDVLRHYQSEFKAVDILAPPGANRPDPLPDEAIEPLAAYLKKI